MQKTFLSANENSTKAQLIALNAYNMTLGKNNQIPLVSSIGQIPVFTLTPLGVVAGLGSSNGSYEKSNLGVSSNNYAVVGRDGGSIIYYTSDNGNTWSPSTVPTLVGIGGNDADNLLRSLAISRNGKYSVFMHRVKNHSDNGSYYSDYYISSDSVSYTHLTMPTK